MYSLQHSIEINNNRRIDGVLRLMYHDFKIYGGFAGTESHREQRDWKNNITVVDGQGSVRCFSSNNGVVHDSITIDGFSILNGKATTDFNDGGGIWLWSQDTSYIRNCIFSGNSAEFGGAIRSTSESPLEIENCFFFDNNATISAGAVLSDDNSTATIRNCIFVGNTAQYGGAVRNDMNSTMNIINCTFSENDADWGAAITTQDSSSTNILNSIIWDNSTNQEIHSWESTVTVNYSDVQGGYNSGTGIINNDPLFADLNNRDLHLLPYSPCIDAGDPALEYNDNEDPNYPGYALYPGLGTVRNDIGAYGGSGITIRTDNLDTDSDGMPDSWEIDNGLNPNNFNDAYADPDTDGFTNLEEFQNGTNPNVNDSTTLEAPVNVHAVSGDGKLTIQIGRASCRERV
jgi:predicted outer membrane repeat protein